MIHVMVQKQGYSMHQMNQIVIQYRAQVAVNWSVIFVSLRQGRPFRELNVKLL